MRTPVCVCRLRARFCKAEVNADNAVASCAGRARGSQLLNSGWRKTSLQVDHLCVMRFQCIADILTNHKTNHNWDKREASPGRRRPDSLASITMKTIHLLQYLV